MSGIMPTLRGFPYSAAVEIHKEVNGSRLRSNEYPHRSFFEPHLDEIDARPHEEGR